MTTIKITSHDESYEIDESKFNPATRLALMTQGLRIIAQRVNASNGDFALEDKRKAVAAALKKVEGNAYAFGSGGGGKTRDPLGKELNRLLNVQLANCGVKTKERNAYTLESWAKEFCEDPIAAPIALIERAEANVTRDAALVVKLAKKITLDPKVADKDLEEEE